MPRPLYQGNHERIKRELLAVLADGTPCPLCGAGMFRSQRLHLGHIDNEAGYSIPGAYYGLVHGRCNEKKGGAVNPWNVRGRAAAARAARPPERVAQLADQDARRTRKAIRSEYDRVQAVIAADETAAGDDATGRDWD